jgi:hypothetical protein
MTAPRNIDTMIARNPVKTKRSNFSLQPHKSGPGRNFEAFWELSVSDCERRLGPRVLDITRTMAAKAGPSHYSNAQRFDYFKILICGQDVEVTTSSGEVKSGLFRGFDKLATNIALHEAERDDPTEISLRSLRILRANDVTEKTTSTAAAGSKEALGGGFKTDSDIAAGSKTLAGRNLQKVDASWTQGEIAGLGKLAHLSFSFENRSEGRECPRHSLRNPAYVNVGFLLFCLLQRLLRTAEGANGTSSELTRSLQA